MADADNADHSAAPLTEQFDLTGLIQGLNADLNQLRRGEISIADARVRADMGRQILRGVHYVIQGRKYLEKEARLIERHEEDAP